MRPRVPRTVAITHGALPGKSFEAWLGRVRSAGVEAVQIREKEADDSTRLALARTARRVLGEEIVTLINGRADLALAASAEGVHLPSDGLSVSAARRLLGPAFLIGRSTHSLAEVHRAQEQGASYVSFGPVFETPGKALLGDPVGLEALSRAASIGLPVLALGGITTTERIRATAAAGAWGIAGIRLFALAGELESVRSTVAEAFLHDG